MASQSDPRNLNETFNTESVHTYLLDYAKSLYNCLNEINPDGLVNICDLLNTARKSGGRIFSGGNGGSAAIAEHLSCDWQKGVHISHQPSIHVQCLTSNSALLTAISNDFGYNKSFAFQLELANLNQNDVVMLISSSGNSENIIEAARYAKEVGAKVIGFTGFKGGKLHDLADIAIYVPFNNYGLVEDAHQIVMHVLAQYHDLIYKMKAPQNERT